MSSSTDSLDALESIPISAVVFAVVSFVVYFCILKPILSPTPPQGTHDQNTRAAHREAPAATRRRSDDANDSEVLTLLAKNTRLPPHMAPSSSAKMDRGGISLLSEGLLPLRYSKAATHEQAESADVIANNRKERAHVFMRILSSEEANVPPTPPPRGSTVVISIPRNDIGCPKLRRVLYLLSTYHNALVILDVNAGTTDDQIDTMVANLRGSDPKDLPEDVLPRHRIVAAQSITGRVAFVRQLSRVEFVLDFDGDVKVQLDRFGIRVFVYDRKDDGADSNESLLGNALL